ncbi:hypothetical protein OB955_03265 [Halobacteria archaeon AArc-m2/3/4]|uniref:Uncharacterized protein n=1 Tax=Natronoglomus mannanivorans TaxID=2979990 RepID=A0AAP2YV94_9EURY|nr:hypothetical protein [Halobacteria archaeon AArc-xg1-1]MCU4971757.1 hypothetical protein [Halobacteria archaeon AArc-m2/3/4]
MNVLRELWKRYVVGDPDLYQAYVSFPTRADGSLSGDVTDRVEELEYAFEGRLDVYARVSSIAIVSDRVPAEQFDTDRFEAVLDRIEDTYAETHSLARLEKWRPFDDRLVKSYVVVPVKPLFPAAAERPKRVRSLAE